MNNTYGNIFRLASFGESHGPAVGGVIDGMPAGVKIDVDFIQRQLDRRRPGQSKIVTARNESDCVELLSGVFNGVSTGTPIGFIVRNSDQHSSDYSDIEHTFRPSHADFTYTSKYGLRDYRGGGRSSARETISRVVGGAIASQALSTMGISIYAYTSQVGPIALDFDYRKYSPDLIDSNAVRCPDAAKADLMYNLIKQIKAEGDSIGGVITGVIKGCPVGIGQPVFGKLHAMLGAAMLGINAAKGFDYGMGFDGIGMKGSEAIDEFYTDSDDHTRTRTNNSGGIQGGISNGEDIYFRVAFKPVATLLRDVATIDDKGNLTVLHAKGRHDPCVLPRAVPVVEAMAAMTLLDAILMNRASRI
ncbi:MAG: chorismate synthase [Muribaculum sp.]|nr:chorismate synthase [Muribaculaceae bacterium]MCM1081629.1 chorismate synthase [Muribaculum sp.]